MSVDPNCSSGLTWLRGGGCTLQDTVWRQFRTMGGNKAANSGEKWRFSLAYDLK